MSLGNGTPRKPKALKSGSRLGVFAPASPADSVEMIAGLAELKRQGFQVVSNQDSKAEGYFAGTSLDRMNGFLSGIQSEQIDGLVALRGGYGSNYLLEFDLEKSIRNLKCVVGFSDLTYLQIYLWQRCRWVTFYGPMVVGGLNAGPGARKGYDEDSLFQAIRKTESGWKVRLKGEPVLTGQAMGRVLGGCLTMIEASIGTPWELDTEDSILVLEDRGVKPYQVDRSLMHLKQAGKLEDVRGILLGDFPYGDPVVQGAPSIREVCARILRPLGVPIVFGAPVGHTLRPMLTLPLGIKARLDADAEGTLEYLEPAVVVA
ncbi:MAG TPA: LD-carboxypeptidase [Candidatus Acidoferrum sp.]|nr:LD-carboxypeptidase [Candidatus Acidoferrum sp.]